MRLYYWIEKHLNDPLFKRETCLAYLMEAEKFQNNNDYYNKTSDPSIFSGIVYYAKPEMMVKVLCKIVKQLKMPGIIDEIKTCILVVTDFNMSKELLREQKVNADLYRQTTTGKNNVMARIAYNLFTLRLNNIRGPRIAWSIIKLILNYIDLINETDKIMSMLRKEISIDTLENCLVE